MNTAQKRITEIKNDLRRLNNARRIITMYFIMTSCLEFFCFILTLMFTEIHKAILTAVLALVTIGIAALTKNLFNIIGEEVSIHETEINKILGEMNYKYV